MGSVMEGPLTEFITVIGLIVVALINARHGKQLKRIDENSAAAAEQTVNDHHDTEYPNLRDEQTVIRKDVERLSDDVKAVRGLVHGIERSTKRMAEWLQDLASDRDDLHTMINRKEQQMERSLAAAVEDRQHELEVRDRRLAALRRDLPKMIEKYLSEKKQEEEMNQSKQASRKGEK